MAMPTSAAWAKGWLKNSVTSPISASLENLIYSYRDSCFEQRLVGLSFRGVWCVCAFYEFKLPQSSLSDEGKWCLTSLASLQYFCFSEQPRYKGWSFCPHASLCYSAVSSLVSASLGIHPVKRASLCVCSALSEIGRYAHASSCVHAEEIQVPERFIWYLCWEMS